ncbi:MAG: hypothetical protein Q8N83_14030 [Ignavibacteria bacterium]|nr:hypothetical protein [Ignavibacteria bacterium]
MAYRNIRYQGTGGGNPITDSGIVQLSSISFNELCAYDKPFFLAVAHIFKCWINQPQTNALGILRNNKLAGYGVMRICRSGYKIGPLFADSSELAERLFLSLKSSASEGAPIFLDTPGVNSAAIYLAKRYKNVRSV